MKIFKKRLNFKNNKEEKYLDRFDDIEAKIDDIKEIIQDSNSNREKVLEDMAFNAKHARIKEYEGRITFLESEKESKDTIIEQQREEIEKLKEKNQKLLGKAGGATKENNKLKKENLDLKAQIKELKSNRYKVINLRPTKPEKQVLGVKKGKINGNVKTELKKINELREKEG